MPCCRVVQCRGSINIPNQSNGFSFTAWGILGVPRSTLNAAAAPVHSSPVLGALCREGASLGKYLPCLPYPGRSGKSHRLVLSCLAFCLLSSPLSLSNTKTSFFSLSCSCSSSSSFSCSSYLYTDLITNFNLESHYSSAMTTRYRVECKSTVDKPPHQSQSQLLAFVPQTLMVTQAHHGKQMLSRHTEETNLSV